MLFSNWQPSDYIVIVLAFIGWGVTFWKGYNSLINKLNNVGEKYNDLVPRIKEVEVKIETFKEELSNERLAVMSLMFNNEKAANERHAQLREELVRLQEKINISNIVRQTINELKDA